MDNGEGFIQSPCFQHMTENEIPMTQSFAKEAKLKPDIKEIWVINWQEYNYDSSNENSYYIFVIEFIRND